MARQALVIEATTQQGQCRSCGAPIIWVTAISGKRMPFDPPVVFADSMLEGRTEVDMARSVSHFATCPDAEKWRGRGR